jgi:hypothetical protein
MSTVDKKTLAGRLAIVEDKRERWRERDARRYELAEELVPTAETAIAADDGYRLHAPGAFSLAAEVVGAANELLDGLGHDALVGQSTKGSYLTQGLLPEQLPLDSPYMRFVLDEPVVAAVTAYLGLVPVLHAIDLWYSFHGPPDPVRSQRWHLDSGDTTQVKVWIHCSDVGADSGPLTVIDAATSAALADRLSYDFGEGHRVQDEQIEEAAGPAVTPLEGPAGTVHFVDTSRCFHMGSRVAADGTPRRVFVAQYLTPYAFRFRPDHLEKAPYRGLADDASSELDRLLLGAA